MRAVIFVMLAACGRIGFVSQIDASVSQIDASISQIDTSASQTDAPLTGCGPAYAPIDGVSFLIRQDPIGTSWLLAEADCESDGGHLLVIEDAAMNLWFQSHLPTLGANAWLGASDHFTEGTFRWVTGPLVSFTNWSIGEPNNYLNTEDCVELYAADATWNDTRCVRPRPYMCECDRIPAATNPSTYCDTEDSPNCGECGVVCTAPTVCSTQVCL